MQRKLYIQFIWNDHATKNIQPSIYFDAWASSDQCILFSKTHFVKNKTTLNIIRANTCAVWQFCWTLVVRAHLIDTLRKGNVLSLLEFGARASPHWSTYDRCMPLQFWCQITSHVISKFTRHHFLRNDTHTRDVSVDQYNGFLVTQRWAGYTDMINEEVIGFFVWARQIILKIVVYFENFLIK